MTHTKQERLISGNKKAPNDSTSDRGFHNKDRIMSHYNSDNQVKTVKAGMPVYNYFVVDYTKTMFDGQINAKYTKIKSEVLAINSSLMVLNDDQFSRISLDAESKSSNFILNEPFIKLYFNDDFYGDGFMFTLYSEHDLSPAQIKKMIADKIGRAKNALDNTTLGFIDNVRA